MAVLPESVQVQCPPFTNIGLDLCGPFTVKTMTNKRATMKVWVVLFLCLNTKGVSMELAPGYSTKDFLLAYMSHVSIRGSPLLVNSDRGSQLTAAHKEVSEDPLRYNWDEIAASTSSQGTSWNFAPASVLDHRGMPNFSFSLYQLSEILYFSKKLFNIFCELRTIPNFKCTIFPS